MKDFLKALGLMAVCCFSLAFLLAYSCESQIQRIEEMERPYEERLGTKFVFEGDTMTIVDYDIVTQEFKMSNGKNFNSKLIFKSK